MKKDTRLLLFISLIYIFFLVIKADFFQEYNILGYNSY